MFFWRKSQRENQGPASWSFGKKKRSFFSWFIGLKKKGEDKESLFRGVEEIHFLWRSSKA